MWNEADLVDTTAAMPSRYAGVDGNRHPTAAEPPRRRRPRLTPEARERFRQNALRHRPWLKSTGPKTAEGKARCCHNARKYPRSPSTLHTILADALGVAMQLAAVRQSIEETLTGI